MKIDGSTKRKVCVLFPLTTVSTLSKQLAVLLCVLSEKFYCMQKHIFNLKHMQAHTHWIL